MKTYTITKVAKYIVYSSDGRRIDGEFLTKDEAIKAIEDLTPDVEVVKLQYADNTQ